MSDQNIKIGLQVSSNGTTEAETKKALGLKAAYDAAASSATKMGGTGGSRAMAAKAAPAGSELAMQDRTYNQLRGSAGITGASARDFANQAQGLGGLVRLYAVYAANLFAASAAFTAFKEAAQTESLTKGLDQLGAASGKALGAMSKQLVEATDGAISLRDAMSAVAQASSAGLSDKQIKDLTTVASKASQALGISMTDALSRLTRGISKIEPELLDELGIFVKIDDATQKYALSVGKTANALSDFERRQAFANATIGQGLDKFAAIEIVANPYDRLLAKAKDLATAGLSLLNTVLTPILDLLSKSPTALLTVFALIANSLIKSAIPSLRNWRQELTDSAEQAARSAKVSYENFRDYSISKALAEEAPKIAALNKTISENVSNAQTALANTLSDKSKILKQAMSGTASSETMEKILATEISRRQTLLTKLQETAKADKTANADKKAAYDELLAKQRQEIANLEIAQGLYAANTKAIQDQARVMGKTEKESIEEKVKRIDAERKQQSAIGKSILANIGSDIDTKGFRDAWQNVKDSVKGGLPIFDEAGKMIGRTGEGLKGLRAQLALAKGAFAIVGSAISLGLAAIAPYVELFGLLVIALKAFDGWASKATKQQEDFNSKTETVAESVKAAKNSLELYQKTAEKAFSLDSIIAFTASLVSISDALDGQIKSLNEWRKAAGVWDTLKDSFAGIFGKDNLSELQRSAVSSINGVLAAVSMSAKSSKYKEILSQSLGITDPKLLENTDKLNAELNKLGDAEKEKRLLALRSAIKQIRDEEEATTNSTRALADSLTNVSKSIDQIVQANALTDLQGKLGVELVNASQNLSNALQDPLKALEEIAKIGKDPKLLAAISGSGVDLAALASAVQFTTKLVDGQKQVIDAREKAVKASKNEALSYFTLGASATGGVITQQQLDSIKKAQEGTEAANKAVTAAESGLQKLKKEAVDFVKVQGKMVTDLAEAGFKKVEIALKRAAESARIEVEKARTKYAAEAGIDTSKQEFELTKQQLDIERSLIDANFQTQKALYDNADALEQLTAAQNFSNAQKMREEAEKNISEGKNVGENTLVLQIADAMKSRSSSILQAGAVRSGTGIAAPLAAGGVTRGALSADTQAILQQKQNRDRMLEQQRRNALAQPQAKEDIAELEEQAKRRAYIRKIEDETLQLTKTRVSAEQELLNLGQQLTPIQTEDYLFAKQISQQKLLDLDTSIERIKIDRQLADIERESKGKYTADQIQLQDILKRKREQLGIDYKTKSLALELSTQRDVQKSQQDKLAQQQNASLQRMGQETAYQEQILKNQQDDLALRQQLGQYTDLIVARKKIENDLTAQGLKFRQEEARLLADIAVKQLVLKQAQETRTAAENANLVNPSSSGEQLVAQARAAEEIAKSQLFVANSAYGSAIALNTLTVDNIKNTGELNVKLLEQKKVLDDIAQVGDGIKTIFGDASDAFKTFGSSFKDFALTLQSVADSNKANADAIAKNTKEVQSLNDIEAAGMALTNEQQAKKDSLLRTGAALQAKADKDELAGNAKKLGAAKTLFKEKSTAFKILDTLEKVATLQSIARTMTEYTTKVGIWWAEVSQKVAAEATKTGIEEASFAAKIPLYIKEIYASWGSMGPWMVGAASLFVASLFGGKGGKMPAGFDSASQQKIQGTGQKLDSKGNIVTDSGGVLGMPEEKADSITSGLEILNKNLFNMLGSKSSIIAKQLEAIKNNTNNTAKALLGKLSGYAGNAIGSMFNTQEGTTGSYFNLGAGAAGAAGGWQALAGGMFNFGGPFGAAMGAALGVILGKKVTTSIKDTGINISGTMGGVAKGEGTLQAYQNVQTTTKRLFGIISNTKYNTLVADLDESIRKPIIQTIQSMNDSLILAGAGLEGSGERVAAMIEELPLQIKVSTQGMNAKDAAEAISNAISKQLNQSAEKIFPYLTQYNQIGEEMGETVLRILNEGENLSYGLNMIGKAIKGVNAETTIAMQQEFIGYFGSIEKAAESINYYFDNFLTGSQRYEFNFKRLNTAFQAANITLPKTKAEYIALVDSVKSLDTSEARKELSALLQYSQDFDKLLSDSNELRAEEIKNLEDSSSKLRDYAKSLREFNNSLVTGSLSIATPLEKFAQLQAEFTSASGLAKTGDLAALGKLQGLSQDLLTSGRELWASGPKYAELFGTVTATLADVANFADAKADVQELQLTALKDTVSLLSNIDANMATLAGGNALQTAATGGYRSGLTLVGELGPELVDFQTPGRVYTADQTAGMFAQAPNGQQFNLVVAELQQLRQEVATLRKDQQRQTGDLIVTNYDATNKLAEQITDAVVQTVTDSNWQNRSKPQIK